LYKAKTISVPCEALGAEERLINKLESLRCNVRKRGNVYIFSPPYWFVTNSISYTDGGKFYLENNILNLIIKPHSISIAVQVLLFVGAIISQNIIPLLIACIPFYSYSVAIQKYEELLTESLNTESPTST
jgi:hypothetical protein